MYVLYSSNLGNRFSQNYIDDSAERISSADIKNLLHRNRRASFPTLSKNFRFLLMPKSELCKKHSSDIKQPKKMRDTIRIN